MKKIRKKVRNGIILALVVMLGVGGAAFFNRKDEPQPALTHALAENKGQESEVFIMDFSNEPDNVIYLAG